MCHVCAISSNLPILDFRGGACRSVPVNNSKATSPTGRASAKVQTFDSPQTRRNTAVSVVHRYDVSLSFDPEMGCFPAYWARINYPHATVTDKRKRRRTPDDMNLLNGDHYMRLCFTCCANIVSPSITVGEPLKARQALVGHDKCALPHVHAYTMSNMFGHRCVRQMKILVE